MSVRSNRVTMPKQDPAVRRRNFDEVALGFTYKQATAEASRCLNCRNKPCVSGCPVSVDIPGFIALIKEGKVEDAFAKIRETNSLPRSVVESALRKTSVKPGACLENRASQLPSVRWSGLLRTTAGRRMVNSPGRQ